MENKTKALLYSFLIALCSAILFVVTTPILINIIFVYIASFFGCLIYSKYYERSKKGDWWIIAWIVGLNFVAMFLGNSFSLVLNGMSVTEAFVSSFSNFGDYWTTYLIDVVCIFTFAPLGWLSCVQFIKKEHLSNSNEITNKETNQNEENANIKTNE
ncbi:MAG: hypothetical protein IJA69_05930 [Clostridia bacterium]|nr:hypothetical protein [Clostridia bacterium]